GGSRASDSNDSSASIAQASIMFANICAFCLRKKIMRGFLQRIGEADASCRLQLVRGPDSNVQLAQLLFGDGRGRIDQQILAALRLRESDHVADLLDPRHQRDGAVEAESDASVRRCAV